MSEATTGGQAGSYSTTTLENALRAKVSMENFYDNLLIQDRDRNNRWRKLEMSMEDMGLSNDEVRKGSGCWGGGGSIVHFMVKVTEAHERDDGRERGQC